MSGLQFRIQFADGRLEQLTVDSDRVLLGSGAHCEIRLPPDQAALEHVLITLHGGAIYAQARALNPPPTVNGAPFTQAPLLPDAILGIGQTQIAIAAVTIADVGPNVIKKKTEQTSPLTYVLAIVAIPLAAYVFLTNDSGEDAGPAPKEIPPLWANTAMTCPQTAPDLARNVALDKKLVAEGKRERGPFHVQDAIAAVPLFETASACFRVSGDQELSKEMGGSAVKLRTQLIDDYRAHQMRLEHSLNVGDARTAQKEVKFLLAMLEGQAGAYVAWLQNLDRWIALKIGKQKEKK